MKWNHKANLDILEQGSPTTGPQTGASCQITSSIRLEIKCIINVMLLNHLETIPFYPQSMGKLSSTKPAPGTRNVGERCYKLECAGQENMNKLLKILS